MLRDRKLLVPTIMVVLALPVLTGLGFWQLERLAWKEGLVAAIEARSKAAPIDVTAFYEGLAGKPLAAGEYTRVTARGRFLNGKELYLYHPSATQGPGFHVVTPLELPGSRRIVFVNRGFVPEHLKDRSSRPEGVTGGEVEVTGLVRAPAAKGSFTPDNDANGNLWFWRDVEGMTAAAFPEGEAAGTILPFFLDAEAAAPGGWPQGAATELKLPNRHLEYALTWFGLAAALAAIYAVYAAGRLRGRSDGGA